MIKALMRRLSPVKRFINIFVKPEKSDDFVSFYKEMSDLREAAIISLRSSDPMGALVNLCNAMHDWKKKSPIESIIFLFSRLDHGQYAAIITALINLKELFALYKSSCSEDDVVLGCIFGLCPFPISEWRKCKDEPKGGSGFQFLEHFNAYDIVEEQARRRVIANAEAIVDAVDGFRVCVVA